MTNRFSLLDLHWDWRKQGTRWGRERERRRESFITPLHVERPKPKLKLPPHRMIEGRYVRRDHYRWFIGTYDQGVIWFYRSDVLGFKVLPETPLSLVDSPLLLPDRKWVELYVEPDAREHPEGKDW